MFWRTLKHSVLSFLALLTFLTTQLNFEQNFQSWSWKFVKRKSQKKWSWRFHVFNSLVQLFFKTSSPGLFKSVTNPKSSGLTKKELKKQCYHDKDSKHHRTPISFLKGKIDFHLKTFISIYLFTLQRKLTWCMI